MFCFNINLVELYEGGIVIKLLIIVSSSSNVNVRSQFFTV